MSKTSGPPAATFEDVMAQADWVRRFAIGLCRDVDTAADVAWDGLTRAWQHPPDHRGPLRPWLATVVRNLVSSDARANARRLARHQALGVINPAAAESPEDQLARWELFKDLVTLVEGLDEPFRQTVQGRYFDGLSAADIARRDGIPEATVRGRLKTGLDRLRSQLDERHEGRSRWVALLTPLLPKAAIPGPATPRASRSDLSAGRDPDDPPEGAKPNPELAARLIPLVRDAMMRKWGIGELTLTCQDRDCRLDVPASLAKQEWMDGLLESPVLREAVATTTKYRNQPVGFLKAMPPGFRDGRGWLEEQVNQRLDQAGRDRAVATCRPGRYMRGTLGIQLAVTTALLPDDSGDDAPIRFAQTGTLAGTSAGDCVAAIYRQLLGDVEVPATLWDGTATFEHEWKD